ncbi:hypothetical protein LSH36_47g07029 [Paralvinella palmiformis]|uniref:SUEL-type lectin domain-containing protein n=1 Tax=Paralvinella palmiformis TaxID=53620 RepID=A0AAD9K7V8_9ANNE|nr:hypothetical protein LSH36_47g07029 [Paralvinella palmiformis]
MTYSWITSSLRRVNCPPVIYLIVAFVLPALAISQGTQEVCQWETFKAECPDGHVIVIAKAVYGRMRLGRCVKENLGYLGCQSDVKTIVDMKCSGRRRCEITIPDVDLDKTKPCSELTNYLEVRYECRKDTTISGLPQTRGAFYRPSSASPSFRSESSPSIGFLSAEQRRHMSPLSFHNRLTDLLTVLLTPLLMAVRLRLIFPRSPCAARRRPFAFNNLMKPTVGHQELSPHAPASSSPLK